MEAFMLKILRRLRKDAPRRFKDLQIACDEMIVTLADSVHEIEAEKYYEPLAVACDSRQPKLMQTALEGLHYLIEHGYLNGHNTLATSDPAAAGDSKPQKSLLDRVIETITKCSDVLDDVVQIQVIKVLLTAITSVQSEIHEANLLLSVRACFHIHLISKNAVNKTTAKTALTQMLDFVTQRMELSESKIDEIRTLQEEVFDAESAAEAKAAAAFLSRGGGMNVNLLSSSPSTPSTSSIRTEGHSQRDEGVTEHGGDQGVQEGWQKVEKADGENDGESKDPADATRENNAGSNDTSRENPNPSPPSKSKGVKFASTDAAMVETDEVSATPGSAPTPALSKGGPFASVHHKDSYLLFRALCKLSMKGLHSEMESASNVSSSSSSNSSRDPIILQNKILSLELVLNVLRNSGPAFRNGEKFISSIKNYLCVSLLSNCTSEVTQVTDLSLQIFVFLIQNFKDHLKNEIEVFLSTIFLRLLESENSNYDHKLRVLEVFQAICRDPNAQIELFINYDCDLDATVNLFSRIVDGFARVTKNPMLGSSNNLAMSSQAKRSLLEEQNIRTMGIEGLVIMVLSLEISWKQHNDVSVSPVGLGPNIGSSLMVSSRGGNRTSGSETTSASTTTRAITSSATVEGAMDESPLSTGSREGEEGDKDTSSSSSSAGNGGRSSTPPASPSATTKEGQQAPPLPPSTPVSTVTSPNMVDVFDRKQKIHEEVDTGILKFNLSAKKGLAYLVQLGHLEKTPQSVAHFFKQYQDRLDKTIIGDYLGREREYEGGFCIMVLHEYVEAMDFQGMVFDMAIRHFLSGFRLPGEAQKIDRIMEKFAERYYLQNSSTFGSADLAFILAFSTIMLQTNLHNPAIRDDKRMTKDQFIKQNKGISTDGDLPDDMLSGIYDRIQAEPISITNDGDNKRKLKEKAKEEANSSFMVFQATSERRKKDAFDSERREMVRAGEAMFKRATLNRGRSSVFLHNLESSKDAYVRPMFDVVWPPTLGVLSQLLEIYDDPALLQLGLEGFHCCIRLACRLDLSIARKTFINALSKFTTLDSVKEMRPKNIMCIQLLLDITLSLGDYLEESWVQVLQLISHLARLQLLSRTDDMFFNSDSGAMGQDGSYFRRGGTDPISKMFLGLSKAENTRLVEEANATLVLKAVDPVLVDRVYSHSINLSGDAVLHFVRGLCEVSRLEISTSSSMNSLRGKDSSTDSSTPRIFSLQKLVEVADFNMHSRSRVEWSNMWNLLAAHFATVGLHDNQALAMYAIDCLRQLSLKFLQKDELSNFNFQRVFLNPFEKIMYATKSLQTKDLVLQCIDIMIKACANNIHSGWRSIFAIFKVAAGQQSLEIATIAFNVIDRLMKDQFNLIIFDFVELLNCLVAFVNGVHTAQSIKAMDFLSQCADHLAQGAVSEAMRRSSRSISSLNDNSSSSGSGSGYESAPQSPEKERKDKDFSFNIGTVTGLSTNDDSSVFRLWWPLLLGLSESVSDPRHEVRLKALDILHAILTDYGSLFSPQTWSVIFKGIVFPIVDSAKTGLAGSGRPTRQQAASKQVWISTMGLKVLTVCLELYMKFRENIENPSISDFILLLEDCICQEIEMLAKMGLEVFCQLVIALGQSVVVEGGVGVGGGVAAGAGRASPQKALESGSDVDEEDIDIDEGEDDDEELRDDGPKVLTASDADVLCESFLSIMTKNIYFDFGGAGKVEMGPEEMAALPAVLKMRLKEMTLRPKFRFNASSARRGSNLSSPVKSTEDPAVTGVGATSVSTVSRASNSMEEGSTVSTPYGVGTIEKVLEADPSFDAPVRLQISLSWGGMMYSADSSAFHEIDYDEQNHTVFRQEGTSNPPTPSSSAKRTGGFNDMGGSSSSSSSSGSTSGISGSGRNLSSMALRGIEEARAAQELLEDQKLWQHFAPAAKTAMVVSLNLLKFLDKRLLGPYASSWQLCHYEQFLMGMEISHRHAVNFNLNTELRARLQQSGFVANRGVPQLLSQEILSIELLLATIYKLYTSSSNACRAPTSTTPTAEEEKGSSPPSYPYDAPHQDVRAFAQPWVQRVSQMVLGRYVLLEDAFDSTLFAAGTKAGRSGSISTVSANSVSTFSSDPNGVAEAASSSQQKLPLPPMSTHSRDRYALYGPSIGIILQGVLGFGKEEFLDNRTWLLPLLARLVRCSNASLRVLVSDIYTTFVNPIVSRAES